MNPTVFFFNVKDAKGVVVDRFSIVASRDFTVRRDGHSNVLDANATVVPPFYLDISVNDAKRVAV